jgi:hypothetical protein
MPRMPLAKTTSQDAFQAVHEPGDGDGGREAHEQVDVVVLAVELDQLAAEVAERRRRWKRKDAGSKGHAGW